MRPTLRTRKPIDEIQVEDLAAFPIWEFATDEEDHEDRDETWVRPVKAKTIGPGLYSLSVAADFRTASGQAILGFVGVSTAGEFELGHAALLFNGEYIFVPSPDYPHAKKERKAVASALGLHEAQVFPLTFTLRVPVQGEGALRSGEFA